MSTHLILLKHFKKLADIVATSYIQLVKLIKQFFQLLPDFAVSLVSLEKELGHVPLCISSTCMVYVWSQVIHTMIQLLQGLSNFHFTYYLV